MSARFADAARAACAWFVAPSPEPPTHLAALEPAPPWLPPTAPPAGAPTPATVALLAHRDDLLALTFALTAALARHHRAHTVVAAVWVEGEVAVGGGAGSSARALAARLAERGHAATASGRTVLVALPADDATAAAALERLAATVERPLVLALGAPRAERLDAALAGVDRALLVTRPDDPEALAELAVAPLAARTVARTASLAPSAVDRSLARAGRARSRLGRRLLAALEGPA